LTEDGILQPQGERRWHELSRLLADDASPAAHPAD
jgi:hypothetical protein